MTRAVLLLALLVACTQQHDPGVVEVGLNDCYACHRSDYEAVVEPPHVGEKPTTCGDCHATAYWVPALDGGNHPETAFPIRGGAHSGIACTDCHLPELGTNAGGQNVSCIDCHTGHHSMALMNEKHHEVDDYSWDEANPTFCRQCHPRGQN